MKFFVPKTTRIFGQVIRIEKKKKLYHEGFAAQGLATFSNNLIELDEELDEELLEQVYIHELMHHIAFNLQKESLQREKFVQGFSTLFHQFLKTAKWRKNSNIPTGFSLGGLKFKVKRVNHFKNIDMGSSAGDVSATVSWKSIEENTIYMRTGRTTLAPERLQAAFFSQVVNVILHQMSESKIEGTLVVHSLGMALQQIVMDARQ